MGKERDEYFLHSAGVSCLFGGKNVFNMSFNEGIIKLIIIHFMTTNAPPQVGGSVGEASIFVFPTLKII